MAKTSKVKVLFEHVSDSTLHRVVLFNGFKFKIKCTNGNSYSWVDINLFTVNGLFQELAKREEITDVYVRYYESGEERISGMEKQYNDCITYIEKVFA